MTKKWIVLLYRSDFSSLERPGVQLTLLFFVCVHTLGGLSLCCPEELCLSWRLANLCLCLTLSPGLPWNLPLDINRHLKPNSSQNKLDTYSSSPQLNFLFLYCFSISHMETPWFCFLSHPWPCSFSLHLTPSSSKGVIPEFRKADHDDFRPNSPDTNLVPGISASGLTLVPGAKKVGDRCSWGTMSAISY